MEPIVFAAVLLAAILHALWNALVKGSDDKYVAMTSVVLGHVPFAVVALPFVAPPAGESLAYVFAGAALHCGYQLFLLFAYRFGDLTQVYPIARGISPLIVAGVSVTFLGVHLSGLEQIAVLVIAMGIFSLVLARGSDGARNLSPALLAVGAGCFIASYSLVDGLGARVSGSAFGFYAWLSIVNALGFSLAMRIIRPGTITEVTRSGVKLALFGGGGSAIAYALVVWAFTQAPIALVTALRETSIVFALLIGMLFLGERFNLAKAVSIAVTLSGAVLLRLAR